MGGYQLLMKHGAYEDHFAMEPCCLEAICFDRIMVAICAMASATSYSNDLGVVKFLKEANIKYRSLNYRILGGIEGVGRNLLAYDYQPLASYQERTLKLERRPLPFSALRQLPPAGCLEIKIELCEEFPPDWAQTFLQYKSVEIQATGPGAMPSFGSFIKLLLTDPCPTLEYFQFPVHHKEHFVSQVEIFELGLERWKIRRKADKGQTPKDYIVLAEDCQEDVVQKQTFLGRRFSKRLLGDSVSQWVEVSIPKWVPFNAAALYIFLVKHLDIHNYVMSDYTQRILAYILSYYSVVNSRLDWRSGHL